MSHRLYSSCRISGRSFFPLSRRGVQRTVPRTVTKQHSNSCVVPLSLSRENTCLLSISSVDIDPLLAGDIVNPEKDSRACRSDHPNTSSLPLLSAGPVGISFATALADLAGNHVFMCAFWSWLVAQVAKVFTAYYREGQWDYKVMFDSGGMPSSHTSLVVGLTTSIAHLHGLGSVYFPLSLAFTLIVMYDAAGVRRHAGKQAEVLNKILADAFHGSPISETKLKEVLGHSPLQVICGAILGVLVASLYMLRFSV